MGYGADDTAGDRRTGGPAPWRNFNQAIETCLGEYFTFRGRGSRSEYWFFTLFCVLANIAAQIADNMTGLLLGGGVGLFETIVGLAILIPSLAATSRRFHDSGWSFWWYLTVLVPVLGWLFVLYVLVTRDPNPNRFDRA